MSVGRPPKNPHDPSPLLAELQAWLAGALTSAGYSSANQFLSRNTRFDKNMVYAVLNGSRLAKLEEIRNLAVVLGRSPDEVRPMWLTAKQSIERREGQRANGQSLSWESLPQLEPSVRDLLLAEAEAAQLLPYQLLGLESPSLPLIYVRQQLLGAGAVPQSQLKETAQDPAPPTTPQEPISAAEFLARHDHVLVMGEPGSGKTALVQETTRRLARIWLRDDAAIDPPTKVPVIPLLLPARMIADAGSFTSALAEAVRRVYGIAMLTELRPTHFAHPVRGSRWLLMIDGLDEVVDQALRVRIIRAIAGHARADAPYRIIVTSRPLPEAELRSISREPFTVCSVEPFGRADVQEFAAKWFATQNLATATQQSREFLQEVQDQRLRELVRNPLLATIAAVAKSRDPEVPLPASRIDLYERLCSYLISSEANGRTTDRQIRQRTGEPAYRAIEWIHARRAELVGWLAEQYLDGGPGLLEAAGAWTRRNLPEELAEALRPDDLRYLLTETGLLVVEGTGLRFTHQTLAEYLAAQAIARRLPAQWTADSDFKALIAQGLDPAQRTFAVFTLVLWGRAGGHLGSLLHALLDGPPKHSLLAGRILADCGETRPAETALVVDRLMEIALGSAAVLSRGQFGDSLIRRAGRSGLDPQAAGPGEAFRILGGICRDAHVASCLRSVVSSAELALTTRADAAVALGRSTNLDAAITILRELADGEASAEARVRIAQGVLALDPTATEPAGTVLHAISADASDSATALQTAQLMLTTGCPEDAVRFAWSVVNNSSSTALQLDTAVQIILRHQAADAVDSLLHAAGGLLNKGWPSLRWILVELVKFGAGARVADFCAQAFLSPATIRWQMPIVAAAWAMAAGPAATEQILDALDQRNARDADILDEMALRLFETGYPDDAFEIAMIILESDSDHPSRYSSPWIALSAAPADRVPEVLALIDQIPASDDNTGMYLLDNLVQRGETRRATARAMSTIISDNGYSWERISAALRILRSTGDLEHLANEIAGQIDTESYTRKNESLIEAVSELGAVDFAGNLARQLISDNRNVSGYEERMARILLLSDGLKSADEIVSLVRERSRFWSDRDSLKLADILASLGALAAATKLWTEVLLDVSASIALRFEACSSLVQSGQSSATTGLSDRLDAGDVPTSEKARAGALHSWTALCDPRALHNVSEG